MVNSPPVDAFGDGLGQGGAQLLVHIIDAETWAEAQSAGSYAAASLETEGFIHLSHPQQIVWVANQFYKGQSGLMLLCIDSTKLTAELRYDEVPGHGTFPHLYGPMNLEAVTQVLPFGLDGEGGFVLPTELQQ